VLSGCFCCRVISVFVFVFVFVFVIAQHRKISSLCHREEMCGYLASEHNTNKQHYQLLNRAAKNRFVK
jgi:hypothetical protein